jgi:hypothetical protein
LEEWEGLGFSNIRIEGAFQVRAGVKNGKTSDINVKSLIGGPLRLVHNGYLARGLCCKETVKQGGIRSETGRKVRGQAADKYCFPIVLAQHNIT